MWPEPKPLRDKLCGKQEELKRTATFVKAAGISFERTRKKKKQRMKSVSLTLVFYKGFVRTGLIRTLHDHTARTGLVPVSWRPTTVK